MQIRQLHIGHGGICFAWVYGVGSPGMFIHAHKCIGMRGHIVVGILTHMHECNKV